MVWISKKNNITGLYKSFLDLTNQSGVGIGIFKVKNCENKFLGTATLDNKCTFLKQAIVNHNLDVQAKLTFYTKPDLALNIEYKKTLKQYAKTRDIKTILSLCRPENKLSLLCQTHTMKLDRPTVNTTIFKNNKNSEFPLYVFLV